MKIISTAAAAAAAAIGKSSLHLEHCQFKRRSGGKEGLGLH